MQIYLKFDAACKWANIVVKHLLHKSLRTLPFF